MTNEVNVTNRHPKPITAMFHGATYRFEPGKTVPIPLDAAVNIFGFNQVDKFEAQRRAGVTDPVKFADWLSHFEFEFVEYIRKADADELEMLKIALETANNRIKELEEALRKMEIGGGEMASPETPTGKGKKK